jgi:hypothetical protein
VGHQRTADVIREGAVLVAPEEVFEQREHTLGPRCDMQRR